MRVFFLLIAIQSVVLAQKQDYIWLLGYDGTAPQAAPPFGNSEIDFNGRLGLPHQN